MAELTIEDHRAAGNRVEMAARFASAAGEHRLWYSVESDRRSELALNADPFVLATMHLAMGTGEDVLVRGEVSPSLLQNTEILQQVWSMWKPERYRPVEIRATVEREPELPPRAEAISGFSGGVDSCFTAFRHARGVTTKYPFPLQSSVMVHGFDIPLTEEDGYRRAAEKAERQLGTIGVELYRVTTNFRELPVDWVDAFGAAVAAVLGLFQRRYRTGLVSQGVPFSAYQSLVEGSNPLTDPMLSSDSFTIVPDGGGFHRVDKIAALEEWQEGFGDLRVCSLGKIRDKNCCVCEKCIRNILSFRALGISRPDIFPKGVSDEQIMALVPLKRMKLEIGYQPILRLAESRGLGAEPWVRALRRAVRLSIRRDLLYTIHHGNKLWHLGRRLGLLG